jgi:hypothetical protein
MKSGYKKVMDAIGGMASITFYVFPQRKRW